MSIYRIRKRPDPGIRSSVIRPWLWTIERCYGTNWLPIQNFPTFEDACAQYALVADQRREHHNRWIEARIAETADSIDHDRYIGDRVRKGIKPALKHMLQHVVESQTTADNVRLLQDLLEEVSQ